MKTNLQVKQTPFLQSIHTLEIHGITAPGEVRWNLPVDILLDEALAAGDGVLTNTGALSCTTGAHTGRSPKDKFIVQDRTTQSLVDWGDINQPMSPEHYAELRRDQLEYLKGKDLYVREAFGGADIQNRIPIRVINESAWANLFCSHLFIRPEEHELESHLPQFTIIHTPGFSADPTIHGTNSETFVVVNFSEGLILIGGTRYAGEQKKSIFSILNFLYPQRDIFPMHCSASIAAEGEQNAALFFGLSGTGKTTLSADPNRHLIGDDEHGWGNEGVFNFEGGCYAKCINLSREKEPQIWDAIRDGAILENVVVDPKTQAPNYEDNSLTENTRAAYPIEHIEGAVLRGTCEHPKNIVFLTCDAFGVMPPISKLTPEQAMYHFLSGYTAKVAGTEKGLGKEPQATFSACFGAPFLPLKPTVYAEMLGARMETHNVNCWLVNTGWVGGGFGVGNRIKLSYTRSMVRAATDGELANSKFSTCPIFGVLIPTDVPGVPKEVLNPRSLWTDTALYETTAKNLASRFVENFKQFEEDKPNLLAAGPKA